MLVERLEPRHQKMLPAFRTTSTELGSFLVEDALKDQGIAVSITYLWLYREPRELVGYVTLLTDSLRLQETELQKKFLEKGVLYKSLPALKIGRLCVDDRFIRRGIGTVIAKFAMITAVRMNETAGCRFLVADAKKDSVSFYRKLGFDTLESKRKETIPMFFDLLNMINQYREGKLNV